jgi:hypothetical protein
VDVTARIHRYTLAGFFICSLIRGQEKGASSDLSAPHIKYSKSVIKLLRKPRLGDAQLTRRGGQTQTGRIVRVTDQFIAFETSQRPRVCENVELSEVGAVRSLRTPGEPGIAAYVADALYLGVFLGPFYAADAIAYPFKRISPPMKPLRGSWERGGSGGVPKSSLDFMGSAVRYRTTISKRGRWLVEQDKLHLTLDGEPEWISGFHFECEELVLDSPREAFRERGNRSHAAAPIVGDWNGRNFRLNIGLDGSAAEEESVDRSGTVENTPTRMRIHWADSTGPGREEWIAHLEHRRIVVSVSGVTTTYHFVPPSVFEFDE